MGCDIHAHVEIKIFGIWRHFGNPNIPRSYALFSKMAGVRNSTGIEPIAEPRGLPADVTWETRFDCDEDWGVDGHSHSWLSGAEVAALGKWYEKDITDRNPNEYYYFENIVGYIFGNGWNVIKYPNDYPKGVEDARLVFWFDN